MCGVCKDPFERARKVWSDLVWSRPGPVGHCKTPSGGTEKRRKEMEVRERRRRSGEGIYDTIV